MQDNIHKGTTAIWGGEAEAFAEGAICVPVFNSVTFNYDDMAEWFDVALGKKAGHIYSRNTNPTVRPLEKMPPVFLPVWLQSATPYFPY